MPPGGGFMARRAGQRTDKTTSILWLSSRQIRELSCEIENYDNLEYLLSYHILLISGQKFSKVRKTRWCSYNSLAGAILMAGVRIKLTSQAIKIMDYLQMSATHESHPIIKINYPAFWRVLARCFYKIRIADGGLGVKILRNTFAYRHYNFYQDKARLRRDMGLSSLRHLPKEIFQFKRVNLFDDVF